MASLRTSQVFSNFCRKVNAIFDRYIACGNSSLSADHAAEIRIVHQDFTRFLSEAEAKGLKQQLFGQVVARVIRQKAEEALPVSWKQVLLVQLCLHVISPGSLTRVLEVQTLVSEIGDRLLNLGTQLSEFIRDTESVDIDTILANFTNLGCFMSAIAADVAERHVYPLDDHEVGLLRQVGVKLVLGIFGADRHLDMSIGFVRLKLFRVATTWFEENKGILENCEEGDLYLCQDRLFSFWESDWLEDRDEEFPILAEQASKAALRSLTDLENRFGHQKLLKVLEEYPPDWVEWILSSLEVTATF